MRPPGTSQQMERCRRQAARLLQQGKSLSAIARNLGASKSSVSQWAEAYHRHGRDGLRPQPTPGRPPKLSLAQKRRLERLLLKGPRAAGYVTDLWTLKRIAQLIQKDFAIRYHPNHLWRLLRGLGWGCQKPE